MINVTYNVTTMMTFTDIEVSTSKSDTGTDAMLVTVFIIILSLTPRFRMFHFENSHDELKRLPDNSLLKDRR